MAEEAEPMSWVEAMSKGNEAYGADRYDEAVELYNYCIAAQPDDTSHLFHRARAYLKLGKHIESLADANAVIARKPKQASAHQLKGEALFQLEEYESALDAFKRGHELAGDRAKPNIAKWIDATQTCINGGSVDASTLKAYSAAANAKDKGYVPAPPPPKAQPSFPRPAPASAAPERDARSAEQEDDDDDDDDDEQTVVKTSWKSPDDGRNRTAEAMAKPGPSVTAADMKDVPFTSGVPLEGVSKYRWQYFQTANKVTLQVFVKKLNKNADRVKVDVQDGHITVEIKDEECKAVEYIVSEDLYSAVKADETVINVLSTQVEIVMVKTSADNWPTFQKSDIKVASNWSDPAKEDIKKVYPTSAKTHKDWDKIAVEVKEEEKTEQLEGDQALQRLFKQIYSSADEDTRRAMNKSFQESGGTVLSTNWKDVGAKTITCTPPEGVKVHKFES